MSTIAAISTPAGVGGISVIRVSGPNAFSVVGHHVTLPGVEGAHHSVGYSVFRQASKVIDEVVVTCFKGPHSFTGEDTVEVACHGSLYVQQAVLGALLESGARLAEPGEFTRRAFVNGKLDLSQAEAVADLIDSTNAANHALAISQLRGGYAKRLKVLRDQFVELASLLELELDFSEEDVEFADRTQLLNLLNRIEGECRRLCDSFALGNAIKNGVPVAIVGRPNVGKSTLLNALVGEERAIVSDIAGTTRDTVEDTMLLDGVTYRFIDTAGIRQSDDTIESLGIERSFQAVEKAQVVLYLTDNATTLSNEIAELGTHVDLGGKHVLGIVNKIDLEDAASAEDVLRISAKTGQGLDVLQSRLTQLYGQQQVTNEPILSNLRHYEALRHVIDSVCLVRQGLNGGVPADLVVIDLREALHYLGTITGQVSSDEVLGSIFSRFCIGK